MADSFGEPSSGGALGLGVTGQGSGAPLLPTLANSLPVGHSSASGSHSGANPASPPPAAAAQSGLTAVVASMSAVTATPAVFGNTFTPGSSPPVVAVSPTVHTSSPLPGVGLGVGGVAGVVGAGLLSQIHATSWDPTLSTDWDNEKASQQCILRIKRDIMSIYKEPPPGMFVVPDPQDMTKIHALITGPFDTPVRGRLLPLPVPLPPRLPHPSTAGQAYHHRTQHCPLQPQLLPQRQGVPQHPGERHPGDSKNYNECIRHETMRVAVCDMLEGKVPCPEALWSVMEKSFLEYYDFYEGVCKERLHLQGQNMQDPFGEKRGRFDYQGLLARLSATHRRIREKSLAEDEHNNDDSDSDTSSSGTDPDSQGSSQP
ncbi:Ubiquitin-conjugating enzyme E2 Z [Larimichthys crocea]|uniref:Uncharacterized protein n=1 Tax=Larimichthys crocea TaxID=215358 RepID=A0ACD3R8G5_LARCR|nr:Ubiquitin-conjugating enzyme E2 Z [Larimichthys crocea]